MRFWPPAIISIVRDTVLAKLLRSQRHEGMQQLESNLNHASLEQDLVETVDLHIPIGQLVPQKIIGRSAARLN